MYDGTLPSTSTGSGSASMADKLLDGIDSSESGSESDLDLSALAPRGREFHRSPRFFQRRNSMRGWGPIDRRAVSSRRFSPSRVLRSRAVGQYFALPPRGSLMSPDNPENVDNEENAEDLGTERFPSLQHIIWRRHFRRRNAQIARYDFWRENSNDMVYYFFLNFDDMI